MAGPAARQQHDSAQQRGAQRDDGGATTTTTHGDATATTMACDDAEGHSERAQRDKDAQGRQGRRARRNNDSAWRDNDNGAQRQ